VQLTTCSKGKVERAGIGHARQNFWPLREFTDLADVNRQAREWRDQVANQRLHRETRQRPIDRFQPDALRLLPTILPDYRDSVEALVHKDMRVQFDGNRYCVPPRFVGRRITLKADSGSVTIYDRFQEIVAYPRCWRRGQTSGAQRFEAELAEIRPAATPPRKERIAIRLTAPLNRSGRRRILLGHVGTGAYLAVMPPGVTRAQVPASATGLKSASVIGTHRTGGV
jgi:hypothetical protein